MKNFSVGFGPVIYSFVGKRGTEYTLRLLPLGGFVSFEDGKEVDEETGEETFSDDPDLLPNRPVLDRAIVISAGVIANIVMAYASLLVSTTFVGSAVYDVSPGTIIASIVDETGPGAKANLRPGDVVLAVDGVKVSSSLDSAVEVASKIRSSGGHAMDFQLVRDGKSFSKRISGRRLPSGESAMGIQLVPNAVMARKRPTSIPAALNSTNRDFTKICRQTWAGLTSMFGNFKESSANLTGPVGVVAMGASLASNEKASLLTFLAVVSLNVALLNALPFIPALDGGQMTFLVIEFLRGKPIPQRFIDAVNGTAFLAILMLSGYIFLNDVAKLSLGNVVRSIMFG